MPEKILRNGFALEVGKSRKEGGVSLSAYYSPARREVVTEIYALKNIDKKGTKQAFGVIRPVAGGTEVAIGHMKKIDELNPDTFRSEENVLASVVYGEDHKIKGQVNLAIVMPSEMDNKGDVVGYAHFILKRASLTVADESPQIPAIGNAPAEFSPFINVANEVADGLIQREDIVQMGITRKQISQLMQEIGFIGKIKSKGIAGREEVLEAFMDEILIREREENNALKRKVTFGTGGFQIEGEDRPRAYGETVAIEQRDTLGHETGFSYGYKIEKTRGGYKVTYYQNQPGEKDRRYAEVEIPEEFDSTNRFDRKTKQTVPASLNYFRHKREKSGMAN